MYQTDMYRSNSFMKWAFDLSGLISKPAVWVTSSDLSAIHY